MKSTRWTVILMASALPAAAIATVPPAKFNMAQARSIALKRAPGKIAKADYEKEDGGWRYSFDIAQGRRIHEIGVDAQTGKIVEDAFERPGGKD